jgi:competence protein ComFC
MVKVNPILIQGRWRTGYALDIQTISSTFLGHDEFGHPRFDNKRSEIGELLYRLKYRSEQGVVDDIVAAAVDFVKARWKPDVDAIIPVPPSKTRKVPPVMLVATGIAKKLKLELMEDVVTKKRDISQLKDVSDYDERIKLLSGAYKVEKSKTKGRKIFLFDDLYRSGATMNEITNALYDTGGVTDVFALTITRTRSNT